MGAVGASSAGRQVSVVAEWARLSLRSSLNTLYSTQPSLQQQTNSLILRGIPQRNSSCTLCTSCCCWHDELTSLLTSCVLPAVVCCTAGTLGLSLSQPQPYPSQCKPTAKPAPPPHSLPEPAGDLEPKKKNLAWQSHASVVVAALDAPGIEAFVRGWRQHFLDMKPRFLPPFWSVDARVANSAVTAASAAAACGDGGGSGGDDYDASSSRVQG